MPKTTGDAELVVAALAGGSEAFGAIVRQYQDAVFGVALARLRSFHDAEDVAQTVFVEAFERLGGLKDPARLGAWLRTITIHRSIDRLRQRQPMADVEHLADTMPDEKHERDRRRRELRDEVLAAIGRLSKVQRETVALFYINGYSVTEVAAIQEVPPGTVKGRLHEARETLKEEMIGVVENVLKSEAPKDDFSRRVFEVLSAYRPREGHPPLPWDQIVAELRRIGSRGIEGFVKAFESPHSPTRVAAVHMLQRHHAPQTGEIVIELLKKATSDANRKVRRLSAEALLHMDVPEARKRQEFVPLVIPHLTDRSKRVRWLAGWLLRPWASDVPLEAVAQALVVEEDPKARRSLITLMKGVLEALGQKQAPLAARAKQE